jgi:hypothetical protein
MPSSVRKSVWTHAQGGKGWRRHGDVIGNAVRVIRIGTGRSRAPGSTESSCAYVDIRAPRPRATATEQREPGMANQALHHRR